MKLPIPDDWDNETWCRWVVCWPYSEKWMGLFRGIITQQQRGWLWDERTGSILAIQEIGREITFRNLPEREVILACDDVGLTEVATSFELIATALNRIADRLCCSDLQIDINGGAQGTITQPSGEVVPIYGSQPPLEMPQGEFPPSYPDESAYLADKCRKANMIIDGLIQTLSNIAAFGTINAITLAVLIAGAIGFGILFPPSLIPTAISVLLIITGSLFLVAQLNAAIIADRDEWVCTLYESGSTAAIVATLADFLDIIVIGLTPVGKIGWALKTLVLLFVNSDTLNQLFDDSSAQGYAEVDCSYCPDCDPISWEFLEETTEGWEATTDMPICFGLSAPNLASIAIVDEKLVVECVAQGDNYVGAIRITGLANELMSGWQLLVRLQKLTAESCYFDVVYVCSDETCEWDTITNDMTLGTYHDETTNNPDLDGKTIEEIYLYFRSNDDATGMTINIEHIRLECP